MELDKLLIPQLKMDYVLSRKADPLTEILSFSEMRSLGISGGLGSNQKQNMHRDFFFQHERINRGLIHNVNIHNAACGVTEIHECSCPSHLSANLLLEAFSDRYTCHGAPLKPAVKAANDINRTLHIKLIYAVSCLEQVGEEEGRKEGRT